MAKKNDNFFEEKKLWSEIKDELLGGYFKPYVSKIIHTRKPLVYIDCFAGKGKFEDGKPGSPIIALDIINECLENTKIDDVKILTTFIDLNHANDLRENIVGNSKFDINIISGKYEDNIVNLLENKKNCNIFLYIDPYGIKALQCSIFDRLANDQFNSIELLINMNSFGFIREACHALGLKFNNNDVFDDIVEYDETKMDSSEKSINELNEIAGGEYWQEIIKKYKETRNGYVAEAEFAEQYCDRLMQNYLYVLNMPLRLKRGQRPKYRLIHATNHEDGCLLMVDNICRRWQSWEEIQSGGQISMFEETYDNQIIDEYKIEKSVLSHFAQYLKWISLSTTLAEFFVKSGAICSTSKINKILKKIENEGKIEIARSPKVTAKGMDTTFMIEGKGKTISVRWKL